MKEKIDKVIAEMNKELDINIKSEEIDFGFIRILYDNTEIGLYGADEIKKATEDELKHYLKDNITNYYLAHITFKY